MSAKPIRVAVLSHSGVLLGYVTRKPSNGSWRSLGQVPRINLNARPSDGGPATRECEVMTIETAEWMSRGWSARLRENEKPPAKMEPA